MSKFFEKINQEKFKLDIDPRPEQLAFREITAQLLNSTLLVVNDLLDSYKIKGEKCHFLCAHEKTSDRVCFQGLLHELRQSRAPNNHICLVKSFQSVRPTPCKNRKTNQSRYPTRVDLTSLQLYVTYVTTTSLHHVKQR